MVTWRHGWQFDRTPDGSVVIQKLDHGLDDVPPLPLDSPPPTLLAQAVIPGPEFAAILAALGALPDQTNTPGEAPAVAPSSGSGEGGI